MSETTTRLSRSTVDALRDRLERIVAPQLAPDVSNYAKGRHRAWLEWEGPLSVRRDYTPAVRDPKLWDWLCTIWEVHGWGGRPDLGLAIHGNIGITPHRDATYAHARAMTVNLGNAQWGWHPKRNGNDAAGLAWETIESGDVLRFDCKHLHSSREPVADRWAIVLWSAKRPLPAAR